MFGRWEDIKVLREIERSESEIVRTLYIESLKSRQIERCQEVSRFINLDRCIYWAAI